MSDNELVLALSAFTARPEALAEPPARRRRKRTRDQYVLVLDTETTVDALQGLTFGSYRYCRIKRGKLRCVEEGLFYAEELDAERLVVLQDYVEREEANVAWGGRRKLRLLSLSEFMSEVFFHAAYRTRALVVGFNLPFDLTRLCADAGEGRGRYRGGFSLMLWAYEDETGKMREHRFRPRLGLRLLDSKRAFMGFMRPAKADGEQATEKADGGRPVFRGRFLDLRTLVFALTNESHSLESACDAFGVEHGKLSALIHGVVTPEYISYNRRDVLATQELLEKVMAEYNQHPISLDPTKAFSPAAIAKAYLDGMGLVPPGSKFGDVGPALRGIAMTTYFGGRAETRIRRTIVPVVHCDFLSMYPTVNTLMGLWRFLIAERIEVEDATEEVQEWLSAVTAECCFDPTFWPSLAVFALVEPQGEILPARARYGGPADGFNIGVNPLTSRTQVWFAGPDLVAAKLLTGRAPRIVRAIRLVPVGTQKKLRSISLRGAVEVRPTRDDFFRLAIEARQLAKAEVRDPEEAARLSEFLKVLANSGAYGIFAEMNRTRLPVGEEAEVEVYGLDGAFPAHTNGPEEQGEYCFSPIAALIPAAARLMLALLEHCVTEAGGTYAMCDTDSMAIVATEAGGVVPCQGGPYQTNGRRGVLALSWAQVQALVDRFTALNPYDRTVVPNSILKIETENYALDKEGRPTEARQQVFCYAISAKRYALFNQDDGGGVVVRKASEHGLGHLLNPLAADEREFDDRDWITQVWEWIIRRAVGQRPAPLVFGSRPAISRLTISSPLYWRPFLGPRWELPYQQRVKPMNFVLSAHVARLGHPPDANPERFHLIAPYDPNPRAWESAIWTEVYSRTPYGITTSALGSRRVVRVRSYGDLIAEYLAHPEAKSAAPSGRCCSPKTVGLLKRRSVVALLPPIYVGKESNQWEEVEEGRVHDLEEVQEIYVDPRTDPWVTDVLPVLNLMLARTLAKDVGVSARAVKAIRNGHALPSTTHRRALLQSAARYARRIVKATSSPEANEAAMRLVRSPILRELRPPSRVRS